MGSKIGWCELCVSRISLRLNRTAQRRSTRCKLVGQNIWVCSTFWKLAVCSETRFTQYLFDRNTTPPESQQQEPVILTCKFQISTFNTMLDCEVFKFSNCTIAVIPKEVTAAQQKRAT
ncbi:Hypothetical_protein [Hexamita inflata]|uniref:Hypothetical_protein n=1 Tax=Hexamita inflata TaxID=28002 RepID=A0AA86NZT1_9EUKA|nr:Hypothetical protein HINF_LOCUS15442 [Hexamita inflata]